MTKIKETDTSEDIYSCINRIMCEVGSISKDRKNAQQGYSFRGIDDVYNTMNPLLAKYGVFAVSNVLSEKREERQTKNGGVLIYTIYTMSFTFYAKDGSSVVTTTVGEAMDSGDKSSNKAMSVAYKYAMMQLFCIPTEEDKDTEIQTHEVIPMAKPKQTLTRGQLTPTRQVFDAVKQKIKTGKLTDPNAVIKLFSGTEFEEELRELLEPVEEGETIDVGDDFDNFLNGKL